MLFIYKKNNFMGLSEKNRILKTIIVSNERRVDIFRIHVFDQCIKFDSHLAYGVSKNKLIYDLIQDIEKQWVERKISFEGIFSMIVDTFQQFEDYMNQYYFRPEELDITGRMTGVRAYSSQNDKLYTFSMFVKNHENLKRISKTEFETNVKYMRSVDLGRAYVDNLSKNDSSFFSYRTNENDNFFMMLSNKDLKLAFVY